MIKRFELLPKLFCSFGTPVITFTPLKGPFTDSGKSSLVSLDGFEPSTSSPDLNLRGLLSRASVPTTLRPSESFEPLSLELITLKICDDSGIRTHMPFFGHTRLMGACLPVSSYRPSQWPLTCW